MGKRSRFALRGIALTAAILLLLTLAASAALPASPEDSQAGYESAAVGGWYLAEGCTGPGFETWVLVQNYHSVDVAVSLDFMTSTGQIQGPQNVPVPAFSRISFNLGSYVTDWDVSTKVTPIGGSVVCERAMYGNGRAWAHESIGITATDTRWYLAEGCTGPGFETWVLVQNPNALTINVDLSFMTSAGAIAGPQNFPILPNSRHSFKVNDYVTDYNVSTKVEATNNVVCERAMYGNNRTWAHDSIGTSNPSTLWYLAEGCTGHGFETWVLVQNPNLIDIAVSLDFMTSDGIVEGPQGVHVPASTRQSFKVNDYVTDYNVSTMVTSAPGGVVCERAMYDTARTWGHDSIGMKSIYDDYYLAEGCTGPGFETWILVQNVLSSPSVVNIDFMTSAGLVAGPHGFVIPGDSRSTINAGDYVTDWDVSTRVTTVSGDVVCERAMYDSARTWAHDSIGFGISPR